MARPMNVRISALPHWNATAIRVDASKRYRLTADGTWWDWNNQAGPEGYPSRNAAMRLVERFRRVPTADWFALIATLDRDASTAWVVGRALEIVPERSGELVCFANDLVGFYWNNSGFVTLTVDELP